MVLMVAHKEATTIYGWYEVLMILAISMSFFIAQIF